MPKNDLPTLPKLLHSFFHEWLIQQRNPLTGQSWRIAMRGASSSVLSLSVETSPSLRSHWSI
jgi:hypothetical protein